MQEIVTCLPPHPKGNSLQCLPFKGYTGSYLNVLEKAKSESYDNKTLEVFTRVENKYTRIAKSRLKGRLDIYRRESLGMTFTERMYEKHSSSLLGKFLRADGHPRPGANWEGNHPEAEPARILIADEDISIRIDDSDNGGWMPKTKADARPTIYPNAIGHNRIHRQLYYDWITRVISAMNNDGLIRAFLNTVRMQLLHGNIRSEMKLQQEIDGVEYYDWLKNNKKL